MKKTSKCGHVGGGKWRGVGERLDIVSIHSSYVVGLSTKRTSGEALE
jgi:hypothetical protein